MRKILFEYLCLGRYGFLLPEAEIIPCGLETLAGELALLKYIEGKVYA